MCTMKSASSAAPTHLSMPKSPSQHRIYEDVIAILTGTLLVSLGVTMFKQAGLLTGGTAGLAFLIHYASELSFGLVFFLINLPFYWLAWRRMGARFTIKTFCSVLLVSVLTELHPKMMMLSEVTPFYVAIIGGLLMGVGFIVLFRHQASLGGINILALYLQDKHGIRAGKLQMAVDLSVVSLSFFLINSQAILASIVGAVVLNLAIAMNHKPGRYQAV